METICLEWCKINIFVGIKTPSKIWIRYIVNYCRVYKHPVMMEDMYLNFRPDGWPRASGHSLISITKNELKLKKGTIRE